jgi:hypothetical protein
MSVPADSQEQYAGYLPLSPGKHSFIIQGRRFENHTERNTETQV